MCLSHTLALPLQIQCRVQHQNIYMCFAGSRDEACAAYVTPPDHCLKGEDFDDASDITKPDKDDKDDGRGGTPLKSVPGSNLAHLHTELWSLRLLAGTVSG